MFKGIGLAEIVFLWIVVVLGVKAQHANRIEYLRELGANDSTTVEIRVKLNGYGKIVFTEGQAAPDTLDN
jgi:hypothetical protein